MEDLAFAFARMTVTWITFMWDLAGRQYEVEHGGSVVRRGGMERKTCAGITAMNERIRTILELTQRPEVLDVDCAGDVPEPGSPYGCTATSSGDSQG